MLIAFGALVGLSLHHQLVMDAFSGRLVPPSRPVVPFQPEAQDKAPAALPMPVLLDEVQQVIASGGLIVDARSPELYAQGHIAGALSLPLTEIEAGLPEFLERIAKDRIIIAYCSGFGCPDSFDLGVVLIEAGYLDVRVFEGGYPEWRDAGLPVTGEKP